MYTILLYGRVKLVEKELKMEQLSSSLNTDGSSEKDFHSTTLRA